MAEGSSLMMASAPRELPLSPDAEASPADARSTLTSHLAATPRQSPRKNPRARIPSSLFALPFPETNGLLSLISSYPSFEAEPSQPDPYQPFFVPHAILFDTPTSSQATSRLLALPPELLELVFQNVKIPYFQVCLALTCKTMARIASKKDMLSPWRGYRDKDGLFRLLERRNDFIPATLHLCRACFLFVPHCPQYWEDKLRSAEFDRRPANWYDIFNWFDSTCYNQHRCPWCCIRGHRSYLSEQVYLKDRAVGFRSDDSRTICPQLHRRMDKP